MDIDDPDSISLDTFFTWKVESLKCFLDKRGLHKDGTKAELAALCFAAVTMKVPVRPSNEEAVIIKKREYTDMLSIEGTVIPDPLKLSTGWHGEANGVKLWPPVYISDVSNYFLASKDTISSSKYLNEYKIGKAYEYFSSDWLKEVFYHPILSASEFCLLRASCTPSMRVADQQHTVWTCIEKNTGKIMCSYCSCTAGLGQTCNHAAGLIFRVEHANRMGYSACTSMPCSWNVPSEKTSYGPKEVSSMTVKKSQYGKLDQRPLVSSVKKNFCALASDTNHLSELADALKDILPNACLYKGYSVTSLCQETQGSGHEKQRELQELVQPITKEHAKDYGNKDYQSGVYLKEEKLSLMRYAKAFQPNEIAAFLSNLPAYSADETAEIAKQTRGQAGNSIWHNARNGRITASRFYSVYTKVNTIKRKPNEHVSVSSLLKQIIGGANCSDDTKPCPKAIKHGQAMEPAAKQHYIRMMKGNHTNFHAQDCGIFIHPQHSYIGASPDMLISCSCCGDGLLEVKCPIIAPCNVCLPNICKCQGKCLKYLQYVDGCASLKKNHCILCTSSRPNGCYKQKLL